MPEKLVRTVGPVAMSSSYTTNIYNQGSALIYDEVNHIHIANKTGAAVTFRLFLGATGANAAGTELFYDKPVPAYDVFDWYGRLKIISTDFLVGGASASASLTIMVEGRQSVV